jgi:hypothetical protein
MISGSTSFPWPRHSPCRFRAEDSCAVKAGSLAQIVLICAERRRGTLVGLTAHIEAGIEALVGA